MQDFPERTKENEEKVTPENPVFWFLLKRKVLKGLHSEKYNSYLIFVVLSMTFGFTGGYFRPPMSGTPSWLSIPCLVL